MHGKWGKCLLSVDFAFATMFPEALHSRIIDKSTNIDGGPKVNLPWWQMQFCQYHQILPKDQEFRHT